MFSICRNADALFDPVLTKKYCNYMSNHLVSIGVIKLEKNMLVCQRNDGNTGLIIDSSPFTISSFFDSMNIRCIVKYLINL
jgi:hypothetical protein